MTTTEVYGNFSSTTPAPTSTTTSRVADRDVFSEADRTLTEMAALPSGDPRRLRLRDSLIRDCVPIARREAARYRRSGEPIDDLNQVALVGLILAIDRFDAAREISFRHFAIPTITGELKRHFRDRSWSVRVSRNIQELTLELRRREPELTQSLGRAPTDADLAQALGVSEEDVRQGRAGISVHTAQSLNRPLYGDGEPKELGDILGGPDQRIEAIADRDALRRALVHLPERLKTVLVLRYVDELTQTQIADKIGISQMQVSRLISRSLALLRRHMMADSPRPMQAQPRNGRHTSQAGSGHGRTRRPAAPGGGERRGRGGRIPTWSPDR